MTHPIIPVILSGGNGTRLWPLSRASHPKQFQPACSGPRARSRPRRSGSPPRTSRRRWSSPMATSASSSPSSCRGRRRSGAGALGAAGAEHRPRRARRRAQRRRLRARGADARLPLGPCDHRSGRVPGGGPGRPGRRRGRRARHLRGGPDKGRDRLRLSGARRSSPPDGRRLPPPRPPPPRPSSASWRSPRRRGPRPWSRAGGTSGTAASSCSGSPHFCAPSRCTRR